MVASAEGCHFRARVRAIIAYICLIAQKHTPVDRILVQVQGVCTWRQDQHVKFGPACSRPGPSKRLDAVQRDAAFSEIEPESSCSLRCRRIRNHQWQGIPPRQQPWRKLIHGKGPMQPLCLTASLAPEVALKPAGAA